MEGAAAAAVAALAARRKPQRSPAKSPLSSQNRNMQPTRPPVATVAALAASQRIRSRRCRQQQQKSHHVLRLCRRDQRPSAPTTSQTTRQLTCVSRSALKELPRPDSYPDLGRSHLEEGGEKGRGRREGSCRCRGGGGFMCHVRAVACPLIVVF